MKSFKIIFLFLSLFIFVVGCKKLGCTNENSASYDESAGKDDGSCVYESVLKVYFNQAQSNSFVANGVNVLHYYLNGDLIGVVPATDFSNAAPTCAFDNSFSTTVSIGKIEAKSFTLIVRDSSENFLSMKALNLKGNVCTIHQLN